MLEPSGPDAGEGATLHYASPETERRRPDGKLAKIAVALLPAAFAVDVIAYLTAKAAGTNAGLERAGMVVMLFGLAGVIVSIAAIVQPRVRRSLSIFSLLLHMVIAGMFFFLIGILA